MKKFYIIRIATDSGTFRVSGLWDPLNIDALVVTSIETIGTDGWILLDQTYDLVNKVIVVLIPILQMHLLNNDK